MLEHLRAVARDVLAVVKRRLQPSYFILLSHWSPRGAVGFSVASCGLMKPGIPAVFAPSAGMPENLRLATQAANKSPLR